MTKVVIRQNFDDCKSSADLAVTRVQRTLESEEMMNCDKYFRRTANNMEIFVLFGPNGRQIKAQVKFKIFPLLRAGLMIGEMTATEVLIRSDVL